MQSVLFERQESETASSSSESSLSNSSERDDHVASSLVSENSAMEGRARSDARYHQPWKARPQNSWQPQFKPLRSPLPSLELLNPSQDSKLRKADVMAATFNLIATIIGGSILSMPLTLAKSGCVLWTAMMIFAAIITDFSLYLFCSCARRTGATSYGEVVRHAFGPGVEVAMEGIIFIYLFMVLVAHMILVKGIWAPMIMALFSDVWKAPNDPGRASGNLVLLIATIIAMPLFLQRDLYGLRHSCYVSFASIFVLCLAMSYRAYQKNIAEPTLIVNEILYVTPNITDVLFAYPIVAQSFVSSFNVVQVHCALVNPTRKRAKRVIASSVFWAFVMMFLFSLSGYFYAFSETKGNILLNFDPTDRIVILGRIGCGVCTLLAMPMSLLPCRDAILILPTKFAQWKEWRATVEQGTTAPEDIYPEVRPPSMRNQHNLAKVGNGCHFDEEALLLVNGKPSHLAKAALSSYAATDSSAVAPNPAKLVSSLSRDSMEDISPKDKIVHYVATITILILCYIFAVLAPGVAFVWSLCGSSMGFLVQFILPSACYIKLRAISRRRGVYTWLAFGLLVLSVFSAVACTAQTFWRLFYTDP